MNLATKKTKAEKLNVQEYLEANPLVKEKLNEFSVEYINNIHKFMEENCDVQAIVRVSFELTR